MNSSSNREALVAGRAGYVGSFLVRRLLDTRYRVRVLNALLYAAGVGRFFGSTCSNRGLREVDNFATEEDELHSLSPYAVQATLGFKPRHTVPQSIARLISALREGLCGEVESHSLFHGKRELDAAAVLPSDRTAMERG